jgi:hypothetical protein
MPSDPPVFEDNLQEKIKSRFLWQDVTQQPKHKATGENKSLMEVVKHLLHAKIFTGWAG